VFSATDTPAINDAAGGSYHFFFRGNDYFFLRFDHNRFRGGYDRLVNFHGAPRPHASGVPDAFRTFNGNGTAGSHSQQDSNSK
jgi:hypothetical protein